MYTLDDFDERDRVQLSPALDAWMFGDKYGVVVKVGRKVVHVHMDRSGKVRRVSPDYIYEIYKYGL